MEEGNKEGTNVLVSTGIGGPMISRTYVKVIKVSIAVGRLGQRDVLKVDTSNC
jgi:hypothetical protein